MQFDVVVASPMWSLNGANIFSANLVRGLSASGVSSCILLTRPDVFDSKPMPLPSDIAVETLPVGKDDSWPQRWRTMARYLEERAPCIYIPNHDYAYSCVSPVLSDRVGVVGIVHSDDPEHYDHVARLGRYWNAIVAVSDAVGQGVASRQPLLAPRLRVIAHGVDIAGRLPERSVEPGAPLKVVYAGRLVQAQKRILDLPRIADALVARGVPVEFTVIGGGWDQDQVMAAARHLIEQGVMRFRGILPNDRVLDEFAGHDVFILTSEFEGMPVSVLEAMGRACVPVVTDIPSGIPELVRDGDNGYLVPVGDIDAFAGRLMALQQDIALRRRLSNSAYATVDAGGYRVADMVARYNILFEQVLGEITSGSYHRPKGKIIPPAFLKPQLEASGPTFVRRLGRLGKRVLRSLWSVYRHRIRDVIARSR